MKQKKSSLTTVTPFTQQASALDVSDWFVQTLAACGIEQSFGYPGAAIEPLYNALSRANHQKPTIAVTTLKHESAAAYAADGYYRVTGQVPLCIATAGPGAANIAAGLASTAAERIPVLVITGNPPMKDFGRGVFQDSSALSNDTDTVALLSHVCRLSALVSHPAQLPHLLYRALSIALSDSPGPVHLSIPLDIFRASLEQLEIQLPSPQAFQQSLPQHCLGLDAKIMQHIIAQLSPTPETNSNQTCLVIGGGCKTIIKDLLQLAYRLEWLVVATPTGKGLVDHQHPFFRGVMGLGGHALAYETVSTPNQNVILMGTRFDESETGGWFAGSLDYHKTIQIDTNPSHFFFSLPAHIRAICNLELFLETLEQALLPHAPLSPQIPPHQSEQGQPCFISDHHWQAMHEPAPPQPQHQANTPGTNITIKPQAVMAKLIEFAPSTTHICADSGSAFMWGMHMWPCQQTAQGPVQNRFHVAMGLGMMGWSIGASIGVAQALRQSNDESPCICITGDGSYLMSSQEIGSAAQQQLNIAFFIINNASLGIVEHCQRILGAEPIAYELPKVDYALTAAGFNVPSFRISNTQALEQGWQAFMTTPGPALFDLAIDHDELPPLGFRLEVLGFSKK